MSSVYRIHQIFSELFSVSWVAKKNLNKPKRVLGKRIFPVAEIPEPRGSGVNP